MIYKYLCVFKEIVDRIKSVNLFSIYDRDNGRYKLWYSDMFY